MELHTEEGAGEGGGRMMRWVKEEGYKYLVWGPWTLYTYLSWGGNRCYLDNPNYDWEHLRGIHLSQGIGVPNFDGKWCAWRGYDKTCRGVYVDGTEDVWWNAILWLESLVDAEAGG